MIKVFVLLCNFLFQDGRRLFVGAPGSWYWQGELTKNNSPRYSFGILFLRFSLQVFVALRRFLEYRVSKCTTYIYLKMCFRPNVFHRRIRQISVYTRNPMGSVRLRYLPNQVLCDFYHVTSITILTRSLTF